MFKDSYCVLMYSYERSLEKKIIKMKGERQEVDEGGNVSKEEEERDEGWV